MIGVGETFRGAYDLGNYAEADVAVNHFKIAAVREFGVDKGVFNAKQTK
jgi:hypothetical protein